MWRSARGSRGHWPACARHEAGRATACSGRAVGTGRPAPQAQGRPHWDSCSRPHRPMRPRRHPGTWGESHRQRPRRASPPTDRTYRQPSMRPTSHSRPPRLPRRDPSHTPVRLRYRKMRHRGVRRPCRMSSSRRHRRRGPPPRPRTWRRQLLRPSRPWWRTPCGA